MYYGTFPKNLQCLGGQLACEYPHEASILSRTIVPGMDYYIFVVEIEIQ